MSQNVSLSEMMVMGLTRHLCFVETCQVVRHSKEDKVTVIGAGVTLHEALVAADILHKKGQLEWLRLMLRIPPSFFATVGFIFSTGVWTIL